MLQKRREYQLTDVSPVFGFLYGKQLLKTLDDTIFIRNMTQQLCCVVADQPYQIHAASIPQQLRRVYPNLSNPTDTSKASNTR